MSSILDLAHIIATFMKDVGVFIPKLNIGWIFVILTQESVEYL